MGAMLKFPSGIYDCFYVFTEVINYIFILKFHNAYKFHFIAKFFKLSRYFSHFIEKYSPFSLLYSTIHYGMNFIPNPSQITVITGS